MCTFVQYLLYSKILKKKYSLLYECSYCNFHHVLGDKERHKLPHDSKVIHAEFTYYYYPGDVAFPCKLICLIIKWYNKSFIHYL